MLTDIETWSIAGDRGPPTVVVEAKGKGGGGGGGGERVRIDWGEGETRRGVL